MQQILTGNAITLGCTIETRGSGKRWIQFRAQGLISAARTLVRGSGARVADEEKALTWSLCVLCVRCGRVCNRGAQYQSVVIEAPWSWPGFYGC